VTTTLKACTVVAALAAGGGGGCSRKPAPDQAVAAAPAWLRGEGETRYAEIESHLRGLDVAMMEIGYRYAELFFAVQDRNWDYADYQAGKIELALKLAVKRRPKRAASTNAFLDEEWPAVLAGVRSRQPGQAADAMERLRTACMKCHVAEQVPFFTVQRPEHRLTSIRPEPDEPAGSREGSPR
jgi:hypothetical protein